MARLYRFVRNTNNPMHVIWHNHKFVQLHVREMLWYFAPKFVSNLPDFGKLHRPVFNTPKKMLAVFVAEEGHPAPFDSTFVIVFARLRVRVSL